jgi:signal transduction histidine kinase
MNQLLFGYDRPGDLQTARNDMQRILSALTRATRQELNVVSGKDELQGQLPELERVRRLTDLFYVIDQAASQAFMLAEGGQHDAAIEQASRQVNFPLTNEMQPLIDQAISEERKEIASKTQAFEQLRNQVSLGGAIIAVLALAGIAATTILTRHRIARQIAALTDWTRAALRDEPEPSAVPPAKGDFKPLSLALAETATAFRTERQKRASADAQLQALDIERSAFLADVGHQLRTPLTVLRGEADVALRGTASEASLRQSLERIRAQSAELTLQLEDLLEAVRQGEESKSSVMSQIELGDVVASAAGEGKILAEPREVEIVVERTTGPIVVPGDFRRLKQALMIGIDNAVKHSPPGSTIRIATTNDDRHATVRVADEGPGVSAEDQPNVFRRFYRGRQENDMLNTGFGIGLSIARQIVAQHGGTIELRNRSQGGALFEIVLPLGEGPGR